MARKKQGRFSRYIRPITYLIDLYIINFLAIKYIFNNELLQSYWFFIIVSASWIVISIFSRFYNVYRYTPEIRILNLLLIQCILFLMTIFSISGIFPFLNISPNQILIFVLYSGVFIGTIKFLIYYFMLKFRADFGGNYRRTIIIGNGAESNSLEKFFQEKTSTGYRHIKTILPNKEEDIEKYFDFILEEKIDEIYCSLPSLSETQIKTIIDFAENNLKTVKFIPSFENLYSKKLKYETYDYVPVLSLRNILLEEPFNKFIKRLFDIVFSLFIIVCVLSWLTPILAVIIKSESKGTIFFRQIRNGYNFKQFYCYKCLL